MQFKLEFIFKEKREVDFFIWFFIYSLYITYIFYSNILWCNFILLYL